MRRALGLGGVLMLAFLPSACGDDGNATGPGDDGDTNQLTQQEQAALTTALGSALGANVSGFADFVLPLAITVGTVSVEQMSSNLVGAALGEAVRAAVASAQTDYEAFGLQLTLTSTSGGLTFELALTGLVAWTGLNTTTQTVDQAVAVFAIGVLTPPATVPLGPPTDPQSRGFAIATDNTVPDTYLSTAGEFRLTSLEVGPPTACAEQAGVEQCTAATGEMSGSYDFNATSPETGTSISQTATFSDIPALVIDIEVNFETISAVRGEPYNRDQ